MWKHIGRIFKLGWDAVNHYSNLLTVLSLLGISGSAIAIAFYGYVKSHSVVLGLLSFALVVIGLPFAVVCFEAIKSNKNANNEPESELKEDTFVPIYQVVDYVRNAIEDNNEEKCYPDTLTAIRQAASDGEIRVIGKEELRHNPGYHDDIETEISPDYWRGNKLAFLATSPAYTDHYHTSPIKYVDGFRDQRWSLQVSKNDVMKKWPSGPEAAFADFMLLSEACRIAYEQTQGLLASVTAEKQGGRNEVLNWYANIIINTFRIALFGARPPSTKILFIEDLRNTHFADGAERLVDNHNENIEYVNLSIRPNDLAEAIQRIMALDKPI